MLTQKEDIQNGTMYLWKIPLKSAESNVGHIRRPVPQREHIHNQRREEMRLSD
jgi:hypothetical protein